DNLCHIAHNVDIGKHTVVIAGCSIGGSAKIGEFCWLAPSSTILENVKIGNYARVGLGAVVVKDVPEHANMVGNPAIDFRIRNKS
ncbi:MAG TPA: hypothetical protein VG603_10950, partial [Chitinophagales bacterium]|nr:hypothetical protein [Chitinophagales bacterium]